MDCQGLRRFLVDQDGEEDDLVGVFTDEYRAHLKECRNCQGLLITIRTWKLRRRDATERLRARFHRFDIFSRNGLPRGLMFQAHRRAVQLLESTWPHLREQPAGG